VYLFVFTAIFPVCAQEAQTPVELRALPEEISAQFNSRLETIDDLKEQVVDLGIRLEGGEGLQVKIFAARLQTVKTQLFELTLSLAKDVASQQEAGFEVSELKAVVIDDIRTFPDQAAEAIDRLAQAVKFNYEDMGPRETVVNDKRLLIATGRIDAILSTLVTYTEIAADMDLDASEQVEFLDDILADAAANRSVFLDVAIAQVGLTRSTAATLPNDEELPAWVSAAEARVQVASASLQSAVNLMNRVGMDTRQYRQQIVTATGELTTDVLDIGVAAGILSQWGKSILDAGKTQGPRLFFRALLVALILFAFFHLARLVQLGVEKALSASKVRISHLLKRMIVSMTKNLIMFIGILFALSQLGISLGPLLAGLGIAGFIIGFALQDTLSNFASGMMILLYRPFDVGDFVEAGNVTGRVDRMSLVNTTFKTLDNQVIVVPNNLIWQHVITNLTAQRTRRIDMTFGISYSDDIDKAKAVLLDVVTHHEACLENPKPKIRVGALGESSVDLLCRPWVRTDDYWETYWDLTELVKKRFDEEGISIPFPQRDVHVIDPQRE
jgi:small conductance mechanosensitive channel